MALNTRFSKYLDCYGPDSVLVVGVITLTAGAPVIVEAQGIASVAVGTTGQVNITLARGWKSAAVTTTLQAASAATVPIVTAITPATKVVQVTTFIPAGAATATTGVLHVQILLRKAV